MLLLPSAKQSKSTKGVGFEKNKKCFSCWYEVMYGQNSLYLYSPTEYNILQHVYFLPNLQLYLYTQIYNVILHLHLVFAVVAAAGCSKGGMHHMIDFCHNTPTPTQRPKNASMPFK
jgi:hypothetical protein